jgi:hypothetical protein
MDSAAARHRTFLASCVTATLLGFTTVAGAQEDRRAFDVVIQLRTFSAPPVSDHRCTHQAGSEAAARVRLSCPTAAQVHAVAHRIAAADTAQGEGDTTRVHLAPPAPGEAPILLTITW